MKPRSAHVVGLALVTVASVSTAHDLRGVLQGQDSLSPAVLPTPPTHLRRSYWQVPNGVLALLPSRANPERDLSVVLTGPGITDSTGPVTVPVEGGSCRPGTVVISPGATLTVDNRDVLSHAFFLSRAGDSTPLAPAEITDPRTRRQLQAPPAGEYLLRDARMPDFRCYIHSGPGQGRVLSVDPRGGFTATGLSDGEYTVKVFFEGTERGTQAVVVDGRSAEVTVTLGSTGSSPPPSAGADRRAGRHAERER